MMRSPLFSKLQKRPESMFSIRGTHPLLTCCYNAAAESFIRRVLKAGPNDFTLLVASAESSSKEGPELKIGDNTVKLKIQYGDFADALKKAADALTEVSS